MAEHLCRIAHVKEQLQHSSAVGRCHAIGTRLVFRALSLAFAGSMLVACAHAAPPHVLTTASKEVATVNMQVPQANTLDKYPELTPDEVGRRFLRLIDSLKSFDELSAERARTEMQLPLEFPSEKEEAFLTMTLPGSGWQYSFSYSINPKYREFTNANFEFRNRNEQADMAPVCGLDFRAYESALKGMGFKVEPTTHDELGRIVALHYSRNNVRVQIITRREADAPAEKLDHACVESISVHAFGA